VRTLLKKLRILSLLLCLPAFWIGAQCAHAEEKAPPRPVLRIGFMPLMSHLTIPVAYELGKGAFKTFRMKLVKFTSWPDMETALQEGSLDGAVFVPTVGDLLQKWGYSCVAEGCENDSALVIGKWTGIETPRDLKGRVSVIAVPHMQSIQNVNLYRFCVQNGIAYGKEIKVVSMSPTDMLASLMRKETQGFINSEPYCYIADAKMIGKIMAYAKDIWPSHPGGVVVVRRKLIEENPALVQEFVDAVVDAGEYIENNPREAASLVSSYFGMDQAIIRAVLEKPFDRVSYGDLMLDRGTFDRIRHFKEKMGLIPPGQEPPYAGFIDDRFVERAYERIRKTE